VNANIENMKTMMIPAYFFSEISVYIEAESYTTVREFKNKLMKKIQFSTSKIPYYGICEVTTKQEEIS